MSDSDATATRPSRRAARHARRTSVHRRRAPMRPPVDQAQLPPIGPLAAGRHTASFAPIVIEDADPAETTVEQAAPYVSIAYEWGTDDVIWSVPPINDAGPADTGLAEDAPAENTVADDSAAAPAAPVPVVSPERWSALRSEGSGFGEAVDDSAPNPNPAPRFEGSVLNEPESSDGRSLTWITWVLIGLAFIALLLFLILGTGGGAEASDLAATLSASGGTIPDSDPLRSVTA